MTTIRILNRNKVKLLLIFCIFIIVSGCIETSEPIIENKKILEIIQTDQNKTSHYAETEEYRFVGADGHDIWLENNPNSEKVHLSELIIFLKEDKTDEIIYRYDKFVCGDYAEVIHNNAEKSGIKTAFVLIDFKNNPEGHAINAFDTIEKGIMFYDSTNNEKDACPLEYFVDLKLGHQLIPIRSDLLHESRFFNQDAGRGSYYTCNYYDIRVDGIVSNYELLW